MTKKIIIILVILAVIVGAYFINKKFSNNSNRKAPVSLPDEIHPFGFTSISQQEAAVAKEVGDTIVRASISWEQFEPKEGKFNFDKFTGAGQNSGFTTIVRFKTGNDWATKCKVELCQKGADCPTPYADCPPKDLDSWSDKGYSPLLYDAVFKTLEFAKTKNLPNSKIIVGNETNAPRFWLGTADDYVKTRSTIYKAVQDANKKTTLISKLLTTVSLTQFGDISSPGKHIATANPITLKILPTDFSSAMQPKKKLISNLPLKLIATNRTIAKFN